MALRSDQFDRLNRAGPTFQCDCGKSYSPRSGEIGHPGYVGHIPAATVVSNPHVRTTARGVWECPACGQRWHSELTGQAQDIDEAARSNPIFVCNCGSTLRLSKWVFEDAAAENSAEPPGERQTVHITRTERLVLEQLVDSKSSSEIATQLSLSEGTVRNAASSLYRKLGVSNRLQAVQVALNTGLVRPVTHAHDECHVSGSDKDMTRT